MTFAVSIDNVMTKTVLLNLKIRDDIREDFRIACELRGATMSGLIHQFIFKVIREEKERSPEAFAQPKKETDRFGIGATGDAEPVEPENETDKPGNKRAEKFH